MRTTVRITEPYAAGTDGAKIEADDQATRQMIMLTPRTALRQVSALLGPVGM